VLPYSKDTVTQEKTAFSCLYIIIYKNMCVYTEKEIKTILPHGAFSVRSIIITISIYKRNKDPKDLRILE